MVRESFILSFNLKYWMCELQLVRVTENNLGCVLFLFELAQLTPMTSVHCLFWQ